MVFPLSGVGTALMLPTVPYVNVGEGAQNVLLMALLGMWAVLGVLVATACTSALRFLSNAH